MQKRIIRIAVGILITLALCLGGVYYHAYRQPDFSPIQPIKFSHKTHVEICGMDCTACHTGGMSSSQAGIPDAQSCLNCHRLVKHDSPLIEPILRSADKLHPGYTGEPIRWVQVNRVASHANFNHQAHTTRGIGCVDCHGQVDDMERINAPQNRGMQWCIECHRNPTPFLRPLSEITNQRYNPGEFLKANPVINEHGARITQPTELGPWLQRKWKISPKTDCTACHQ